MKKWQEPRVARIHQPSEWDQIVFFNRLDLYHTSPDSGAHQYRSRTRNRRFDATLRAGGWIDTRGSPPSLLLALFFFSSLLLSSLELSDTKVYEP